MRKPFMAGNWKMNLDRGSIDKLLTAIKEAASGAPGVEVAVFPPYVYLAGVVEIVKGTNIIVGGQDLYFEAKGAFTSQISGPMLKDVGATHVLIGHSERRHVFHDSAPDTRKKVAAALKVGLVPVLCVGEKLPEREAGRTEEVVLGQVREGLEGFGEKDLSTLMIAYEPVWAIGTGVTATPEQAGEAHALLRRWFSEKFSSAFAENLRILYGGSVTPENVKSLMVMEGVDGTLVGGASLKAETFGPIIRFEQA